MDKIEKTLFIYLAPHPIHQAFASTVTNKSCPCGVSFSEKIKNLMKSIFSKNKYDVLFLESGTCLPVAIFKKKKEGKIILLNAETFFYYL